MICQLKIITVLQKLSQVSYQILFVQHYDVLREMLFFVGCFWICFYNEGKL